MKVYDRNVMTSRLIGANKRFIEEHIPHLASILADRIEDVVETAEVVVVGYGSPEFLPALRSMRTDQIIIDLARVDGAQGLAAKYESICW